MANERLLALARELDLPLVATNDCHYLNREDARAHEVLLCIQTGKTMVRPFPDAVFHARSFTSKPPRRWRPRSTTPRTPSPIPS